MTSASSESWRYYDEWTVPKDCILRDGNLLSEFVRSVQDQMRHGLYQSALEKLHEARENCTDPEPKNAVCAFVVLLLGLVYRKVGEFDLATENLQMALMYFRRIGDIENQARGVLALGDVWRARAITTQDNLNAQTYWSQALDRYREADQVLGKAREVVGQNRAMTLLAAQILWAQARVYLALGQHPETVRQYLFAAWHHSESTESIWAQEECAQLLGRHFESVGNIEEARKWYKVALNKAKTSHNVDRLIETYLYLARLASKLGDQQGASRLAAMAQAILKPLLQQDHPLIGQFIQFYEEARQLCIQRSKNDSLGRP